MEPQPRRSERLRKLPHSAAKCSETQKSSGAAPPAAKKGRTTTGKEDKENNALSSRGVAAALPLSTQSRAPPPPNTTTTTSTATENGRRPRVPATSGAAAHDSDLKRKKRKVVPQANKAATPGAASGAEEVKRRCRAPPAERPPSQGASRKENLTHFGPSAELGPGLGALALSPLGPASHEKDATPCPVPVALEKEESQQPPSTPPPPRAALPIRCRMPQRVSPEQALRSFTEWKSSLWYLPVSTSCFAGLERAFVCLILILSSLTRQYLLARFVPADFQVATEDPTIEMVWVPYRDMTLEIEAVLSVCVPSASSSSSRSISCELAGPQRLFVCACGSEEEWQRMKNIEDERPPSELDGIVESLEHDDAASSEAPCVVRREMSKKEMIRLVKSEIKRALENRARAEIQKQTELSRADMKQPRFDTLRVQVLKERVVLVPVYRIAYRYGEPNPEPTDDPRSNGESFLFLVNGFTNKFWGERPWGMGTVLSYFCPARPYLPPISRNQLLFRRGIGVLANIFGTDDDRIGFVRGSLLRRIDSNPHYNRQATYLVFPPSHSYVITSASGWIKLVNNSCATEGQSASVIELISWPRKGQQPEGRFALAPGQEQVFDFRVRRSSSQSNQFFTNVCPSVALIQGRWCIEVQGNESSLRVAGFDTTGGGGFGNKLSMDHSRFL